MLSLACSIIWCPITRIYPLLSSTGPYQLSLFLLVTLLGDTIKLLPSSDPPLASHQEISQFTNHKLRFVWALTHKEAKWSDQVVVISRCLVEHHKFTKDVVMFG